MEVPRAPSDGVWPKIGFVGPGRSAEPTGPQKGCGCNFPDELFTAE